MDDKGTVYFSVVCDPDKWESAIDSARLIAIPKKWWNIKQWILVNSFLEKIDGFARKD